MLHNDIIGHDRAKNIDITRNLKNASTRHYQNNPHMSMESSFAYIMSNSGIFRALPVECIEEARRYLALPKTFTPNDVFVPQHGPYDVESHSANARAFINTTRKHCKQFPECSVENAYMKCLTLSPIFRNLSKEYLADVRAGLGLPAAHVVSTQPLGITEYDLAHREIPRLSTHDLWEFIKLVSDSKSDSETLGNTFGRVRRETHKFFKMNPIDTHDAWTQLSEMQANKPKPSTTVVHAERVVVDNKKMIKILEFENVQKLQDLPAEYFDEYPYYHIEIDGRLCIGSSTTRAVISIDNVYIIKDFGQMIKTMKEAGVRLSKINKTAKLEKEHSGKFVVNI